MMIARILLAGALVVATARQSSLDVSASVVAPSDGRDIEDAAKAPRIQPLRVASPDSLGNSPEWTQQRVLNFLQPPPPTHPLICSSNHLVITLSPSVLAANPNARLGTNFANYYKTDGQRAYADMHNAGTSNDRVTFNMTALNPSQGIFEWSAYDALVNDATAANI
jgi:hypothetical protein